MKLQGKENLISDMFAILKAFLPKLDLFKNQIAKGNFTHSSNGKTLASDNETELGFDLEKYTEALKFIKHCKVSLPTVSVISKSMKLW